MARAAAERLSQLRNAWEITMSEVAQLRHAELAGRLLALGAAGVVLAAGDAVRDARVDDDQVGRGWQGNPPKLQAARVQEQRRGLIGQAGGHLIHDPAAS